MRTYRPRARYQPSIWVKRQEIEMRALRLAIFQFFFFSQSRQSNNGALGRDCSWACSARNVKWAAGERGFWMDVPDRAGENPTTCLCSLRFVKAGGSPSWASAARAFDRMPPPPSPSGPSQPNCQRCLTEIWLEWDWASRRVTRDALLVDENFPSWPA
ncbi:uncharacterized protein LY79DRAFT_36133 [Colletotrichum navitas]|uniref:Uncharacterized protein n=1 Tax=Colletotrichum navitas TaxID=681940 RepID=A0AAD8Q8G7_9PEZI|nr:uncharacterized protein LY79DRAFT_36133 [Colletotrichum navitas]KAK1596938.1 hypothetical protein LY79DRAFT_36133 [Colletotrichum navitas]